MRCCLERYLMSADDDLFSREEVEEEGEEEG